jgi:hypothetical protein
MRHLLTERGTSREGAREPKGSREIQTRIWIVRRMLARQLCVSLPARVFRAQKVRDFHAPRIGWIKGLDRKV